MFITEALAGDAARLSSDMQARLGLLDQLCPGDFASVNRQATILDTVLDPMEFLAQLEAEHRLKPEVRENRAMGFVQ